MHLWKIIALILFIAGFILIILGGMYNPYLEEITLSPGEIKGFTFHLKTNESMTVELSSTDFFTMYIMNESTYKNSMNGNFSGSYYTKTTKDVRLRFTAPKDDTYYIVIANINSQGFISVDLIYGYENMILLMLAGVIAILVSIVITIYEIWKEKNKKIILDATCPYCNAKINSSWNFCPVCRYPLRGEKYEK